METRILRKKSKVAKILKILLPRCYPKDIVLNSQNICPQWHKIQNSAKVFIVSMTTGHVTSGSHGKNIFPWSTINPLYFRNSSETVPVQSN